MLSVHVSALTNMICKRCDLLFQLRGAFSVYEHGGFSSFRARYFPKEFMETIPGLKSRVNIELKCASRPDTWLKMNYNGLPCLLYVWLGHWLLIHCGRAYRACIAVKPQTRRQVYTIYQVYVIGNSGFLLHSVDMFGGYIDIRSTLFASLSASCM